MASNKPRERLVSVVLYFCSKKRNGTGFSGPSNLDLRVLQ